MGKSIKNIWNDGQFIFGTFQRQFQSMTALKLTTIPLLAIFLDWLMGWHWGTKEYTLAFIFFALIVLLFVIARRARQLECPIIFYHVRPYKVQPATDGSTFLARISITNGTKELYLSMRPRTGNKDSGVTAINFEEDTDTPKIFRADDAKGQHVSFINEDPLRIPAGDMVTFSIMMGRGTADTVHQYAYFVITGQESYVHYIPLHKEAIYMARGKHLSLEEARKSDKLKQFSNEHPSVGDEVKFDTLLDAMAKPKSSEEDVKT